MRLGHTQGGTQVFGHTRLAQLLPACLQVLSGVAGTSARGAIPMPPPAPASSSGRPSLAPDGSRRCCDRPGRPPDLYPEAWEAPVYSLDTERKHVTNLETKDDRTDHPLTPSWKETRLQR